MLQLLENPIHNWLLALGIIIAIFIICCILHNKLLKS